MKKNAVFAAVLLSFFPMFSQKISENGANIIERFAPPDGYARIECESGSFAEFLRKFPLKKFGAPVLLYNGEEKMLDVHISVFDFPLLKADLIQCADALMKLRAEYLYGKGRFSEIKFHITNGMLIPFSRYVDGERVIVSGNKAFWKSGFKKGHSRDIFEQYLKFIYTYAGTFSLSKESKSKPIKDIQIGDFFINGGSPGHTVLVLDIAQDSSGRKIMLLGQSYMPSQEFHILKSGEKINPWYSVEDSVLETPEWTFGRNSLMSFE